MSTLTKLALGMMGQLRPKPAQGDTLPKIALPTPQKEGGMALMEALSKRQSARQFAPKELSLPLLSNLLWAAYGVNRPDKGRTAPSALNSQEIDIYVALPSGAYLYDATANVLQLVAASDVRRVTGYQDFVSEAALDLGVCCRPQSHEVSASRKTRELCIGRGRCYFAECISVRGEQRVGHRNPGLD